MYNGTSLKIGVKFLIDGQPFEVLNYAQKVVGRGGSIVNVKIKNLISGAQMAKTFSDKDTFSPADITKNSYDYLYKDTNFYYFMNQSTFEQISVQKDVLSEAEWFLVEGDKVLLQEFNHQIINISFDPSVLLEVIDTPPGEKGNTVTGAKKPAQLSTGLTVNVPLFINRGDFIKVDTRTKEYLSKA